MKLDASAMAYACAALFGVSTFVVGLAHLASGYGAAYLEVLASVYPGYHVAQTFSSVLIGTGYAMVDGAIGGWLLAWCYNRLAGRSASA